MSIAGKALFVCSFRNWSLEAPAFIVVRRIIIEKLTGLLLLLACVGIPAGHAQHGHDDHGHESPNKLPSELANLREERPQVVSFQRYESQFRSLCNAIAVDGRREDLFALYSASIIKEGRTCPECRALYKVLSSACREQKKREVRRKKVTPEVESENAETEDVPTPAPPTPTPLPRRLPSAEVIDLASRLTVAIAEEASPKTKPQIDSAMLNLSALLMEKREKSPGLADYCAILGTYLVAPWQRDAARQKRADKLRPKDKEDSNSVDTLFEE